MRAHHGITSNTLLAPPALSQVFSMHHNDIKYIGKAGPDDSDHKISITTNTESTAEARLALFFKKEITSLKRRLNHVAKVPGDNKKAHSSRKKAQGIPR